MKRDTRYFLIFCISFLTAVSGCDTESNTENPDLNYFVKYFGGDGNQYGVDMVDMGDGSFVLLGTDAASQFETVVYLLRVDSEGNVLWETRYGDGTEIWTAKDIEPTLDGNLIIVADYKSGVDSDSEIKLLKFSPDGTFISLGTYGTPGNENSRSVTPLSDGGYIISGTTDSTQTFNLSGETDPDLGDVFNLRVDANLTRYSKNDWSPVYHGFGDNVDVAVKIFERPGADFYVFGYSNSTLSGDLNPNERLGLFYFSRNRSFGTLSNIWYPGNVVNVNDTEITHVTPVNQAAGGGYLVVGTSQSNVGLSEMFLARLRPSLTFSNPLQNEASFYNVIPLGRNIRGVSGATSVSGEVGFLLLGNEVRSTGATNFWLSKVDQTGKPLWSTTFGSEAEDDTGAAVMELQDGKIVILGTMGLADNQFKMAFIKVNRDGKLLK